MFVSPRHTTQLAELDKKKGGREGEDGRNPCSCSGTKPNLLQLIACPGMAPNSSGTRWLLCMGQKFSVLTGYSVWDRTSVYSLVAQYGTEFNVAHWLLSIGHNLSVLTGYSLLDRTSVYSLVTQYGTELQCTHWLLSYGAELKCSSLVAQYGTELQCSSLVTQYGTELQCSSLVTQY